MKKPKKTWADLSTKEKSYEKKKMQLAVFVGENTVGLFEPVALPTKRLRDKQENFMRFAYTTFNKGRKRVNLKPKEYKRFNSKGEKEVII